MDTTSESFDTTIDHVVQTIPLSVPLQINPDQELLEIQLLKQLGPIYVGFGPDLDLHLECKLKRN